MCFSENHKELFYEPFLGKKSNMNGLIFWQKSENPVFWEVLGIFSKRRIFEKNKNKLALSIFDP